MKTKIAFIATLLTIGIARGDDAVEPKTEATKSNWEASAEASLLLTSGNTEVTTLGLGAESTYHPDPWAIKGKTNYIVGKTAGVTTAESFAFDAKGERKLGESLGIFVAGSYFKNEFAGFKDRYGLEGGVGYAILEESGHTLSSNVGLGFLKESLVPPTDRTFATISAGLQYKWKISESAELSNTITFLDNLSTTDDWRLGETLSITTIMTEVFSLKASFKVDYLNVPVTGKKSTDTTTTVALVAKL